MALDDYLEPEVAVAVAVTAAIASPRARRVMRQGAVYSVAGVLKAGDALGAFTRGVGRGVKHAAEETAEAGADVADDSEAILAPRSARTRPARARTTGPARSGTTAAPAADAAGPDTVGEPQ